MAKHKKQHQPKEEKMKQEEITEQNSEEIKVEVEEKEPETSAEENKIEQLETEIEQLKDKLLRKAAEFENYKRRTENDQLNLLNYAAESFIIKLLPIVDDMERTIKHIDSENNDAIKEGIKLLYNKFIKTLEEQGVKKMETVGKPFDVNFHDALMQQKDDSVPPHTVLDEIETGYLYKDKVIRHAKVIVSEETTDNSNEDKFTEDNSDREEEKD